jgi:hypothetical protein
MHICARSKVKKARGFPKPRLGPIRVFTTLNPRRRLKQAKVKKAKKAKRVKYTKSTRAVQITLIGFGIFLIFASIRAISAGSLIKNEAAIRKQTDDRHEGQLRNLGASSTFPMSDAIAKAQRMAYECFTVPNYGVRPSDDDLVGVQNKALRDSGIPAGDDVNCGWNGKGRGMVINAQVVSDPYWAHNDRTTVILQLKPYQRPGFFYYYVPFKNNNGKAEVAGMPAIFGTASGALDVLKSCSTPDDSVDTDQLASTAQLFLDALAGETNVPLGYLVYGNAKFGGFGPAVNSPKVSQVMYCGTKGQEKLFAALVTFNGPIKGSKYTLPYAFGVVPNAETSGKYQVKEFGPAPSYTGS